MFTTWHSQVSTLSPSQIQSDAGEILKSRNDQVRSETGGVCEFQIPRSGGSGETWKTQEILIFSTFETPGRVQKCQNCHFWPFWTPRNPGFPGFSLSRTHILVRISQIWAFWADSEVWVCSDWQIWDLRVSDMLQIAQIWQNRHLSGSKIDFWSTFFAPNPQIWGFWHQNLLQKAHFDHLEPSNLSDFDHPETLLDRIPQILEKGVFPIDRC